MQGEGEGKEAREGMKGLGEEILLLLLLLQNREYKIGNLWVVEINDLVIRLKGSSV